MKSLQWITVFDIPAELRALHETAWQGADAAREWEIDTYSLPAHPLTDAIDAALGIRGQGIACGFARLHADNASCWRGMHFVSLVITGYHWIEAAGTPATHGDAHMVNGIPGTAFVLRPQSWHCAIPMGDGPDLRLAQWEVPTKTLRAAVTALKALAA